MAVNLGARWGGAACQRCSRGLEYVLWRVCAVPFELTMRRACLAQLCVHARTTPPPTHPRRSFHPVSLLDMSIFDKSLKRVCPLSVYCMLVLATRGVIGARRQRQGRVVKGVDSFTGGGDGASCRTGRQEQAILLACVTDVHKYFEHRFLVRPTTAKAGSQLHPIFSEDIPVGSKPRPMVAERGGRSHGRSGRPFVSFRTRTRA